MNLHVDYPWAIPYWAHRNNYYRPDGHGGVPNKPKGFVLHTPEEPAGDNYPGTPIWFARDLLTEYGYSASTHYFLEAVEDPNRQGFCKVYQCVPENCAAVANGVIGKPYPAWASPSTSLNWQSLSLEWEGKAESIHQTIDSMQMKTAAHLISHRAAAYGFPTDREHVIGHYQVSTQRTDPGALFPWSQLMQALSGSTPIPALEEDDEMKPHYAWAAWFTGREIAGGPDIYAAQLRADFQLPAEAKAVLLQPVLERGATEWFHGNSDVLGVQQGNAVLVLLDEQGTANFRVTAGCKFKRLQCVGYFR